MKTRWRLIGQLTTCSPMHIGTGDVLDKSPIQGKDGAPCDVQAIVKGRDGRPCIPGTALKGVLRSWAEATLKTPEHQASIDRIFGNRDIKDASAQSGWAEFCAAHARPREDKANDEKYVPYWNNASETGIVSHVCIDRTTGAASDAKLFFEEFVPEGTTFDVEIDATRLSENDIALLIAILKQGSSHQTHPFQFGASGADGWGRMKWKFGSLLRCDAPVQLKANQVGFDCCQQKVAVPETQLDVTLPSHISLELTLKCDGPFLVNDASRTHKKEGDDLPNFTPLRRADGGVWLPASSFRGALRERAEFLLRSLDENASGDPNDPKNTLANGPIERIFGQTSQASVLTIEEFTELGRCTSLHQDFVAIDRWTGGAADGAKFDSRYASRPQLRTKLILDTSRHTSRLEPSDVALLGLALRDVCSGQVPLGWGGSKGYGSVQGLVSGASMLNINPDWKVPLSLLAGQLDEAGREWIGKGLGRLVVASVIGRMRSVQKRGKNNTIEWGYLVDYTEASGTQKSTEIDAALVPESLRNRLVKGVIVRVRIDDNGKVCVLFPSADLQQTAISNTPSTSRSPSPTEGRFAHPYYFLRLDDRGNFADSLQDAKYLPSEGPIGHKRFHAGFYSGKIQVKLRVETPLLICDNEDKATRHPTPDGDHLEYPVRTDHDGKPLLASTSVRGMLRSAYEAITNSRLGVFSDVHKKKLSFRPPVRGARRTFYSKSPLDCLPLCLRPATSLDELSPADRVFGWVNQDPEKSANDAKSAYRSHLRIGPISCLTSAEEAIERFPVPKPLAILGQPKPQQGRFYLGDHDGHSQQGALTKEQSGYTGSNRIRGSKVYPHHPQGVSGHAPSAYTTEKSIQNRSINGYVKPTTEFVFDLHFTNLSRTELSALVWLLTLPPEHFLRLGLGKPLGFGSVRVTINDKATFVADGAVWIQSLTTWGKPPTPIDLPPLVKEFAEVMSVANSSLLDEFQAAARGFGTIPIHYPRTNEQQLGSGENFKWFVQNEKLRAPHSLPDLLPDPLLPILAAPPPRH